MCKYHKFRIALAMLVLFSLGLTNPVSAEKLRDRTLRLAHQRQTDPTEIAYDRNSIVPDKTADDQDTAPIEKTTTTTTATTSAKTAAKKTVHVIEPLITFPKVVDDELLELLPADCLLCVRINNLDKTLMGLDTYLTDIFPFGASAMIKAGLGGVLDDETLASINTKGDFIFFITGAPGLVADPEEKPDVLIGLLLPPTNVDEFTSKLQDSKMPSTNYALFTFDAKSKDSEIAIKENMTKSTLLSVLSPAEQKQATTAPLWAFVNIQQVANVFSPLVSVKLDEMRELLEQVSEKAAENDQVTPQMNPAEIMELYFNTYELLVNETRSLSLTAEATAQAFRTSLTIAAKPDSKLAAMLTKSGPIRSGFDLAAILSGTDAVNVLGKFDKELLKKFNTAAMEMFPSSMIPGSSEKMMEEWKTIMAASTDAMGDEMAIAFSLAPGTPPFTLKEIVKVEDMAAYREIMKKSSEMVDELYSEMGLPMDFTFETGTAQYMGVSIDTISIAFKFPEDDPSAAIINAMYGEGLVYKMALTDNLLLLAIGPDSDTVLKGMIDQARSPSTSGPAGDIAIALAIIPNAAEADMVASVNILKLIAGALEFMKAMPIPQVQMMGQLYGEIDIPTQSCLASAMTIDNGGLTVKTVLPKQHLTEIMAAVIQVQQKMMEQMMKQMMTDSTDTPPAEALTITPGVGIGNVTFGMNAEQMKIILGEPQKTTGNAYEYINSGFAIVTNAEGAVIAVTCGDASLPDSPLVAACKSKTDKGIGMGSTKEQIIEAYGDPSSTQAMPGMEGVETMQYESINASFTLREAKVVHMFFQMPKE